MTPQTESVKVRNWKVEPQDLGNDIFKFLWKTFDFPNGQYTLTVRAYDVRGRVGETSITVWVYNFSDVYVKKINHPSHGTRIPVNQTIVPRATIKNVGTRPETLKTVCFLIRQNGNTQYFRSLNYFPGKVLNPGNTVVCSFPGWTPTSFGLCSAKCYTYIARDTNRCNDTAYSFFTVVEDRGDQESIRD